MSDADINREGLNDAREAIAETTVPEPYRRYLRLDQPGNWTPSEALIQQLWSEKSDAQKKFWCSLTIKPEPKTGRASCGHEADEDGECGCSAWPERAPAAHPLDLAAVAALAIHLESDARTAASTYNSDPVIRERWRAIADAAITAAATGSLDPEFRVDHNG